MRGGTGAGTAVRLARQAALQAGRDSLGKHGHAAERLVNTSRGCSAAAAATAASPASALRPGAVFTAARAFGAADVAAFTALTGDANPIHASASAAAARGMAGAVLPGMLLASLFPAIIGSHFPGALYLTQTLKFKAPALVGESVEARLTVERSSGSRVTFQTLCCRAGSGEVLVEGAALALVPQAEARGAHAAAAARAAAAAAAARGEG